MLLILIDILERFLDYLKPFASNRNKDATPAAPLSASPPASSPASQPAQAASQAPTVNTAAQSWSIGAELVTRTSAQLDSNDETRQLQELADALEALKTDQRNNSKKFGKKKRGKIWQADGNRVVFENLFFTEVIWLQLQLDFSGQFIFDWPRGT